MTHREYPLRRRPNAASIGYWIGESYAGKGFMVDALDLLARLCV